MNPLTKAAKAAKPNTCYDYLIIAACGAFLGALCAAFI